MSRDDSSPSARKQLEEQLAAHLPDQSDILRIVDNAGLSRGQLNLNVTAVNLWHEILQKAAERRRIRNLAKEVNSDTSGNAQISMLFLECFADGSSELFEVPELHLNLINRAREDNQVGRMLETLVERKTRRPLVLVLHGDERHDHRGYINRLKEKVLPEMIQRHYGQTLGVVSHELPLDSNMLSAQEVPELLQSGLRDRFNARDVDQIVSRIATNSAVVLTVTEVNTRVLSRLGTALIARFLEFWAARTQTMTSGQWLIPCLLVAYEATPPWGWRRLRLRDTIARIRAYLRTLRADPGPGAAKCPENIDLLVLDEPSVIDRTHAASWVTELAGSQRYREQCLTRKLNVLFAELPDGSMYLRELKAQLAEILERCGRI
jgi:hypothetical protein